MRQSHGEPVEVTACDGRPAWFMWRGRRYVVLVVRQHWVISTRWWQRNRPEADLPPERKYWRVAASAGADDPVAVYDLRHDTRSGVWQLALIWD